MRGDDHRMQSLNVVFNCLYLHFTKARSFEGIEPISVEEFGDLFHWRGWLPLCSLQGSLAKGRRYLATYLGHCLSIYCLRQNIPLLAWASSHGCEEKNDRSRSITYIPTVFQLTTRSLTTEPFQV